MDNKAVAHQLVSEMPTKHYYTWRDPITNMAAYFEPYCRKIERALDEARRAAIEECAKIVDERIECYRNKHQNESASKETKSEQRFAIECLEIAADEIRRLLEVK